MEKKVFQYGGIIIVSLLVVFFLVAKSVYAKEGQVWLDLTVGSHHGSDWRHYVLDKDTREVVEIQTNKHNETNPGLGLSYGLNDYVDLAGGYIFKNSYENESVYSGFNIKYPFTFGWLRLEPGVAIALSTGYKNTPVAGVLIGDLMPWVLPNVTAYVGDRFYARVGYFPDFDGKHENVQVGDVVKDTDDLQDLHSVITFQVGVKLF